MNVKWEYFILYGRKSIIFHKINNRNRFNVYFDYLSVFRETLITIN